MADPIPLLGDDEDDYPVDSFRVNKTFSGHYDTWRQKEEMQKLKDLKKNMSDSSSSESESEEEPVIEKDFLKALSMLKSEDPRIYSEGVELFKDDGQEVKKKPKVKKEKPMLMKDYERELVLTRSGQFSDDDDPIEQQTFEDEMEKTELPTLGDVDSDEDDMFCVPKKDKEMEEKEDADYLQFLKGEKEDVKEDAEELSYLHQYWNDPKLDKEEQFLRDYILNEKFLVKDKSEFEITCSSKMAMELSDDEKMVQEQEEFEQKYNFRFEEPDTEFIKRYPRTIGESLRKEDKRRKLKREEYTERKKKEKEQKREELKRLKALKRKEIEEKFLKLKEITGQEELNFDEEDIESDFDPDKHDKKMQELFNDDYYSIVEKQKPEFEYDEELDDEKWDLWTREKTETTADPGNSGDDEEEDIINDEENEEVNNQKQLFEQEMVDSTRVGRKKSKKKSLFAKIISQPKPAYDPEGKSFDQYLDEYYKMDFEDVVGDLPVRFKYRKVIPNDFGLSVDEILAANDKELNRWCSVKKTHQYRRDEEEMYEVQAFQKKAQNEAVKKKILASVYSLPTEKQESEIQKGEAGDAPAKAKRRKKKKKKCIGEDKVGNSTKEDKNEDPSSDVETSQPNVYELPKSNSSKEPSCLCQLDGDHNGLADEGISKTYLDDTDVSSESAKNSKKKRKSRTSGDFKVSDMNDVQSVSQELKSPKIEDSSSVKEAKRKLEDSSDASIRHNKKKKSSVEIANPESKQGHEKFENVTQEEASGDLSPKKSRKRKRRPKNKFSDGQSSNKNFVARNFSGSKTQNKIPEANKKLALADGRLASYGLNPKKFKSRIIYFK